MPISRSLGKASETGGLRLTGAAGWPKRNDYSCVRLLFQEVKFGFALFDDEKGMPARWVRVAFVTPGSKGNITSLFSTDFSERALGKAVRAHCTNVFVGPPPSSSLEPLTLDDQCAALFLRASDEVRPGHHSILRFHALDKMSMFPSLPRNGYEENRQL